MSIRCGTPPICTIRANMNVLSLPGNCTDTGVSVPSVKRLKMEYRGSGTSC